MSTLENLLICAFLVAIVLVPKAVYTWLALRDEARASRMESRLERSAGGAE